jgi:hypothetical protein
MSAPQGDKSEGRPGAADVDDGVDGRLPAVDNTFIESHIRGVRTFLQSREARLQKITLNLGDQFKLQEAIDAILRKEGSSFNQGFDMLSGKLAEHAQRLTSPSA